MVHEGSQHRSESSGRSHSQRRPLAAGSQQRGSPPPRQGSRSPSDNGLRTSATGKEPAVGQQSREGSPEGIVSSSRMDRNRIQYQYNAQPFRVLLEDIKACKLPPGNHSWLRDNCFGVGEHAIKPSELIRWFEDSSTSEADKEKYLGITPKKARPIFEDLAKHGYSSTCRRSTALDLYRVVRGLDLPVSEDSPTLHAVKKVLEQRAIGKWNKQPYNEITKAGPFGIDCVEKLHALDQSAIPRVAGSMIWSNFGRRLNDMSKSKSNMQDRTGLHSDTKRWLDVYDDLEALQRAKEQNVIGKIKTLEHFAAYKAGERFGSPSPGRSPSPRKAGSPPAS